MIGESRFLVFENHVKIDELTKNKFSCLFKLVLILLTAPLTLQILYVIFHCVILRARNVQRACHAYVQDLS